MFRDYEHACAHCGKDIDATVLDGSCWYISRHCNTPHAGHDMNNWICDECDYKLHQWLLGPHARVRHEIAVVGRPNPYRAPATVALDD